jgi:flagellar basal body-associated protein FliL
LKKKLLILIILVFIGGGFAGYYFLIKKTSTTPETKAEVIDITKWNPYAQEKNYMRTLKEILVSANNGAHIVKMNITVAFQDEASYKRFLGSTDPSIAIPASSHTSKESPPMEIAINSFITTFLLKAPEADLKDIEKIQINLRDFLNTKLELDKNIIKQVYIENYVLQ